MIHRLFSLRDGVIHRFCSIFLQLTFDQSTAVLKFTQNLENSSSKMSFHDESAWNDSILTLDESSAVFDFTWHLGNWLYTPLSLKENNLCIWSYELIWFIVNSMFEAKKSVINNRCISIKCCTIFSIKSWYYLNY